MLESSTTGFSPKPFSRLTAIILTTSSEGNKHYKIITASKITGEDKAISNRDVF
ncbi:MAG: hypothetical protein H5T98_02405 [Syntrophomonadaceae bacterium]|nr:hypothetical protein [Syntrophomonadaceae bacterium]